MMCDQCFVQPTVALIRLTTLDGELLDTLGFCADCAADLVAFGEDGSPRALKDPEGRK